MDYASLRQQGIRQLEQLSGGMWTDFNTHDPGLTILETLCYAITDLGYRISHPVADLLAEGGRDPYEHLHQPDAILTTQPVTVLDLRRLCLDVEGVRNAWIEPVEVEDFEVYYHPGREELSLEEEPPSSEPWRPRGLHRVLIETSDLAGIDGTEVRAEVTRRLHAHRGLCEDFAEIRVLESQSIQVHARIEVGDIEDAGSVLLEIFNQLAGVVSPNLPRRTLAGLLEAGEALERIYDGPPARRGFIDDAALQAAGRRSRINVSDLIHAVLGVPGVRAVRDIAVAASGPPEAWSLKLDPARTPSMDWRGSKIQFEKNGIAISVDREKAIAAYYDRLRSQDNQVATGGAGQGLMKPAGRDRDVSAYCSIQHHLPDCYGIGEFGLPDSATPERKARAKQLKAYLMFFDQLLANHFAQLAHARDLLSFDQADGRSYFAGLVDDPTLDLDEICPGDAETRRRRLEAATEEAGGSWQRTNRFLNHLLARFAEQFTDYSLLLRDATLDREPAGTTEQLALAKQAFLRNYPRVSSARGTACDYLAEGGGSNASGLEERIRLKLGLDEKAGERFLLVEHILLRPMQGDQQQQLPLLAGAGLRDPYSLQLSFVFPEEPARFQQAGFRRFIEQTIREETPAHLIPYVHWADLAAWTEFQKAYAEWIDRRRQYWAGRIGGGVLSPHS